VIDMDATLERQLRRLVDVEAVKETLYRYASSIDDKDFTTLRSLLADDATARYGDHAPVVGGDAVVGWIKEHTDDRAWQHHKLTVYHVDLLGDDARALTYHTSHQTRTDEPDTVIVMVARYRDELRRHGDRWLIGNKVMEIGWRESRTRTA
jgi:3-phenylpropionate/cinnamic acid dioxygenase small subunit